MGVGSLTELIRKNPAGATAGQMRPGVWDAIAFALPELKRQGVPGTVYAAATPHPPPKPA